MRKRLLLRLALLIPLLVAVFILHVGGTALVIVHIARIALIVALALIGGRFRARRSRGPLPAAPLAHPAGRASGPEPPDA